MNSTPRQDPSGRCPACGGPYSWSPGRDIIYCLNGSGSDRGRCVLYRVEMDCATWDRLRNYDPSTVRIPLHQLEYVRNLPLDSRTIRGGDFDNGLQAIFDRIPPANERYRKVLALHLDSLASDKALSTVELRAALTAAIEKLQ